jgi:hypothetical protein
MRVSLRELHRRTGAAAAIEKKEPVSQSARGFAPEHWEDMKRLPRFQDDSGRLISESRDRG